MKRNDLILPAAFIFCALTMGIPLSCTEKSEPYFLHQDLDSFDTLYLNAVFTVELIESDHFAVDISGDASVSTDITFRLENRTLVVDNKNGPLWKHPYLDPPKLTIYVNQLKWIHVEETCNLYSSNAITSETFGLTLGSKLNFADLQLDCKLFFYWNTSPVGGQLTLRGHSDVLRLYSGNLLGIDASQLTCHDAVVENGSKSDVHVYVDQKFYYSISGTGNIYLTGSPAEIEAGPITSSGRLIY